MTEANLILSLVLAVGNPSGERPESTAKALEIRGKWILDENGKAVPSDSFRRGLQTSALARREGELWSVGDQRSEYPGHLFRIDPRSGRLIGAPIRLRLPPRRNGNNPQFEVYRSIPNSDLEGLAVHPRDPDILFAVTEDKTPWVVEIHLACDGTGGQLSARIVQLTVIRFPEGLNPWRDDRNFRMEGLTVSDDARTLYLAFERADDDLPRIYSTPLDRARSGKLFQLEEVAVRFGDVPRRTDKEPARLNINDIQFLRDGKRPILLAMARDQERLLVIDLDAGKVSRVIDLDLRDADGHSIFWVSPEGLAFDRASDRLWLVNDPDSVRGNYRRRDEVKATKLYADYAPLLFETKLSKVLGRER